VANLDSHDFRRALADVVAYLIEWESGVEAFIAELRCRRDYDLHDDDALL
jgi:hypothetical protein